VKTERVGDELRRGQERELFPGRHWAGLLVAGRGEAVAEADRRDADPAQHARRHGLRRGLEAGQLGHGGRGRPERCERSGLPSIPEERTTVHGSLLSRINFDHRRMFDYHDFMA
jgi:hypothetical protein